MKSGRFYFNGMLLVVETQTADGLDIFECERCKQVFDICYLFGDFVGPEDWSHDDLGLSSFGNVGLAQGENGISIVGSTIFGKKSYESLLLMYVSVDPRACNCLVGRGEFQDKTRKAKELTEKVAIFEVTW